MANMGLLDFAGAAEYLGLSECTLRRYVSLGLVPYTKLGLKLVRFDPERLREWVESRRVEPRSNGR
jgi:excisionase family DNA binding protein